MDRFLILHTVLHHKLLPYFILLSLYSPCSLLGFWHGDSFRAPLPLYERRKVDRKLAKGVRRVDHWTHVRILDLHRA